ncbi:MAG: site-specific integrase, partial [Muribaculaceae bacterium]|nr:site-specific integrase [Muribaculaceae bacterium]
MLYENFYNYLRSETARSSHTLVAYRHDIEEFRTFYR